MEKKHSIIILTGLLVCCLLAFSGCKNDYEDQYQGYGIVDRLSETSYQIKLDNGHTLNPKEAPIPSSELKDSMRLSIEFSVLEERDSSSDVKIYRATEILTKPVLAYDTAKLDSIGNDPIKKISSHWVAYGFLNFEFVYAGSYPVPNVRHMVNLLQHPATDGVLEFEFRHNAYNDQREQFYQGVVSFPIGHLLDNQQKPMKIKVKYHDTSDSYRTLEFTY